MAEDVVNGILTSGVVLGAGLGLARSLIGARQRNQRLEAAGTCTRCKGTCLQECQLCYGRGSSSRPGYINVVDPHHRAPCKRCDGFGRHTCGLCGGVVRGLPAQHIPSQGGVARQPQSLAPPPPLLAARPSPPRLAATRTNAAASPSASAAPTAAWPDEAAGGWSRLPGSSTAEKAPDETADGGLAAAALSTIPLESAWPGTGGGPVGLGSLQRDGPASTLQEEEEEEGGRGAPSEARWGGPQGISSSGSTRRGSGKQRSSSGGGGSGGGSPPRNGGGLRGEVGGWRSGADLVASGEQDLDFH